MRPGVTYEIIVERRRFTIIKKLRGKLIEHKRNNKENRKRQKGRKEHQVDISDIEIVRHIIYSMILL